MHIDTRSLGRSLRWLGVLLLWQAFAVAPAAATPVNDACENATVISSIPFDGVANAATATTNPGEVAPCVSSAIDFVWYAFTPTADGFLEVNSCGSSYDTVITAYTGACTALTPIACDDDSSDCGLASRVTFGVSAGQRVLISVAAFSFSSPPGQLSLHVGVGTPPQCLYDETRSFGTCSSQTDPDSCAATFDVNPFYADVGTACGWNGSSCQSCLFVGCVDTCGPPPPCYFDGTRTFGTCVDATNEATCETLYDRNPSNSTFGSSCGWNGSTCGICGFGVDCVDTCLPAPTCFYDPTRSLGHCASVTDQPTCEATFDRSTYDFLTGVGCAWDGFECVTCDFGGPCIDACAPPPLCLDETRTYGSCASAQDQGTCEATFDRSGYDPYTGVGCAWDGVECIACNFGSTCVDACVPQPNCLDETRTYGSCAGARDQGMCEATFDRYPFVGVGLACGWDGATCLPCSLGLSCANTCVPPPICAGDQSRTAGSCSAASTPDACAATFETFASLYSDSCCWTGSSCLPWYIAGCSNVCDVGADSDGDGLPDELDQCRYASGCINDSQCTPFAPECAGCPAFLHADDDGDGVPNCIDACPGEDDHADTDGDGVVDCLDQCPTEPGCSTDCPIFLVGCRGCPRFRFQDDDRDGVLNCVDSCAWANDSTDSDGDGSPDCVDPCPAADDARDSDGDGMPDCEDDCPLVYDPDQADADHDGVGNACDDPAPPLAYRLLRTLRETTPSAGDQFGSAVAALPAPRRTILIGAPFEGAAHAGAAHVFDGSAGDCVTSGDHCEVLTPLDVSDDAQFGRALAMHATFKDIRLSGTSFPTPVVFAEIGGPEADGGRGTLASIALKFESSGGDFVLDLQQGIPLAPAPDARFGDAVVARDAFMAVGAPGQSADGDGPENAFAGKAWVMNLQRGGFTVGAREIRPPRRTGGDLYGSALAISSAMVAVGAPGDSAHGADQAGAVHIFGLSGVLLKTIENPHPADGDQFGSALAFVGNVLVVGAPRTHLGTLENVGSVYFFDLAGSPYGAMLGMTTPPDPSGGELFGFSIASLDDFAVVGAPGTMQGTGAAYLVDAQPLGALRHVSGHVEQVFLNPTPSPGDRFGTSVAAIPEERQFGIFPGTLGNIVIGAPGDDFLHDGQVVPNAGAAYLYGFCGPFCQTGCGNGMVEPSEDCDDGGIESGDGCGIDCHVERCSDGVVAGTEQCDDGNKESGDGCSSDCTIEDGYKCIGGPSQCTKPVDPCESGPGIVVNCCACPTASCEDGNPCTDDRCDTEHGIVVHVTARKEIECDDHDDYTRDECNPQDGSCMHFPMVCPPYSQCVTQKYDPLLRRCVPDQKIDGCCVSDSSCTGGDPCSDLHCRVCEGCEYTDRPCCGQVASCVPGARALPAGHECDDGDACTKNDVCAGGQCRGTLDCDDHDPCTDDSCGIDGCENKPIDGCAPCGGGTDAECDDGVYCDGVETCDPGTLRCHSTPIECPDDGDPCTSERCTEANQRCEVAVVDNGTVKCRVQVGLSACTAPPEKTGQLFDHAVKLVDAMMALLGSSAAGDLPRDLARSSRRLLSEAQGALRRGALAARQAERQGQVAAECRDALADAARDGIKQLEQLKTDRGLRRAKKARKRG